MMLVSPPVTRWVSSQEASASHPEELVDQNTSSVCGDLQESSDEEENNYLLQAEAYLEPTAGAVPELLRRADRLMRYSAKLVSDKNWLTSWFQDSLSKRAEFDEQCRLHLSDQERCQNICRNKIAALEAEQLELQALCETQEAEEMELKDRLDEALQQQAATETHIQRLMDQMVKLLSVNPSADSVKTHVSQVVAELEASDERLTKQLTGIQDRLEAAKTDNIKVATKLSEEQQRTKRLHDSLCSLQADLFGCHPSSSSREKRSKRTRTLSYNLDGGVARGSGLESDETVAEEVTTSASSRIRAVPTIMIQPPQDGNQSASSSSSSSSPSSSRNSSPSLRSRSQRSFTASPTMSMKVTDRSEGQSHRPSEIWNDEEETAQVPLVSFKIVDKKLQENGKRSAGLLVPLGGAGGAEARGLDAGSPRRRLGLGVGFELDGDGDDGDEDRERLAKNYGEGEGGEERRKWKDGEHKKEVSAEEQQGGGNKDQGKPVELTSGPGNSEEPEVRHEKRGDGSTQASDCLDAPPRKEVNNDKTIANPNHNTISDSIANTNGNTISKNSGFGNNTSAVRSTSPLSHQHHLQAPNWNLHQQQHQQQQQPQQLQQQQVPPQLQPLQQLPQQPRVSGQPVVPPSARLGLEEKMREALEASQFHSVVVRLTNGWYQFGDRTRAALRLASDGQLYATTDGRQHTPFGIFIERVSAIEGRRRSQSPPRTIPVGSAGDIPTGGGAHTAPAAPALLPGSSGTTSTSTSLSTTIAVTHGGHAAHALSGAVSTPASLGMPGGLAGTGPAGGGTTAITVATGQQQQQQPQFSSGSGSSPFIGLSTPGSSIATRPNLAMTSPLGSTRVVNREGGTMFDELSRTTSSSLYLLHASPRLSPRPSARRPGASTQPLQPIPTATTAATAAAVASTAVGAAAGAVAEASGAATAPAGAAYVQRRAVSPMPSTVVGGIGTASSCSVGPATTLANTKSSNSSSTTTTHNTTSVNNTNSEANSSRPSGPLFAAQATHSHHHTPTPTPTPAPALAPAPASAAANTVRLVSPLIDEAARMSPAGDDGSRVRQVQQASSKQPPLLFSGMPLSPQLWSRTVVAGAAARGGPNQSPVPAVYGSMRTAIQPGMFQTSPPRRSPSPQTVTVSRTPASRLASAGSVVAPTPITTAVAAAAAAATAPAGTGGANRSSSVPPVPVSAAGFMGTASVLTGNGPASFVAPRSGPVTATVAAAGGAPTMARFASPPPGTFSPLTIRRAVPASSQGSESLATRVVRTSSPAEARQHQKLVAPALLPNNSSLSATGHSFPTGLPSALQSSSMSGAKVAGPNPSPSLGNRSTNPYTNWASQGSWATGPIVSGSFSAAGMQPSSVAAPVAPSGSAGSVGVGVGAGVQMGFKPLGSRATASAPPAAAEAAAAALQAAASGLVVTSARAASPSPTGDEMTPESSTICI